MDYIDFLLPVLSVVVGWVLNELSSILRYNKEDKKDIKQLILILFELKHFIASQLRGVRYTYKLYQGLDDATKHIESTRKRNKIKGNYNLDKYNDTVLAISRIDPLLAKQLIGLDIISAIEKLELIGVSENPLVYSKILLSIETLFEEADKNISGIIKRMAKKVGLFYYIINFKSYNSLDEENNESIADYFGKELADEVQNSFSKGFENSLKDDLKEYVNTNKVIQETSI